MEQRRSVARAREMTKTGKFSFGIGVGDYIFSSMPASFKMATFAVWRDFVFRTTVNLPPIIGLYRSARDYHLFGGKTCSRALLECA